MKGFCFKEEYEDLIPNWLKYHFFFIPVLLFIICIIIENLTQNPFLDQLISLRFLKFSISKQEQAFHYWNHIQVVA